MAILKKMMQTVSNRIATFKKTLPDLQKTPDRLKNDDQFYRLLLEQANDAIYLLESDTRKIIHCNNKAVQMMGYTYGEIINLTAADFHPPEERDTLPELLERIKIKTAKDGSIDGITGIHHQRKDGSLIPVEINIKRLKLGKKTYHLSIVRDITERKKEDHALRLTQYSMDNSAIAIFWHTPNTKIVYVNKIACRILGYTREELLNMSIPDIDPLWSSEYFENEGLPMLRKNKVNRFESKHRRKDGKEFPVEISSYFVDYEGEERFIAFATDISERKQTENTLRENEKRFRYLFNSVNDAILVAGYSESGPTQRYIDANDIACKRYGYSREEFLKMTPSDLNALEFQGEIKIFREKLFKEKQNTVETVHIAKGGLRIPVEVNARLIELEGKPAILSIARDISERKQAENALAESEERYRTIFNTTKDGVVICDDKGVIEEVNPELCFISGFSEEEMIGQHLKTFVPPEDSDSFEKNRAIMNTSGEILSTGMTRTKSGSLIQLEIRGSTFQYRNKNYYMAIVRDITERVKAEESLRRSEKAFRSLFELSLDGIVIVSDGRIIMANDAFCDLLGYSREELLVMKKPISTIHPEDRDEFAEQIASVEKGESYKGPWVNRVIRKDGTARWIDAKAQKIEWEGKPARLSFLRDTTNRRKAEEALRRSEEAFRSLFEQSQDGIIILEGKKVAIVNKAFCDLHGYSVGEITGLGLITDHIVHPEDRIKVRKYMEAVASGVPMPETIIARGIRKDGTVLWVESRAKMIDWKGRPARQSIVHDITDRVEAEEALIKSEEAYRNLYDQSLDGISVISEGKFLTVNQAICDLLGYSREELLSMERPIETIHPDFRIKYREYMDAVKAGGSVPESLRILSVCKDGSTVWRELRSKIIEYKGKLARQSIIRDINDIVEADRALRQYSERIKTLHLIDQAILGAFSMNKIAKATIGHILNLINCTYAAILSFGPDEKELTVLANASFEEPDIKGKTKIPIAPFHQSGSRQNKDIYKVEDLSTLSESASWITELGWKGVNSFTAIPLKDKDRLTGSLYLASENPGPCSEEQLDSATEIADSLAVAMRQAGLYDQIQQHAFNLEKQVRKRTAQLEDANRELEAFSYSVSHDLRAPLRHINGFITLLNKREKENLDSTSARYMNIISESANSMGSLIDDILSLSRLGRVEMNLRQIKMNALIEEVRKELLSPVPDRRIVWEIDPLPAVTADPVLLRQVWANLLSNAIKFTSTKQEAHIKIGTAEPPANETEKGEELIFFVKDNGVGFDSRYTHKLFGVFQRLHRDEEFEGTGIGLATVQRIIHRHGGRVWAEGARNSGAVIYFTLPLKKTFQH